MSGIMGRRPAQGSTRRVLTPGKHWLTQSTSGLMRSARMSRLKPLNSAVPATRKRSTPRRLVTSLVSSSSRLTFGAAAWLCSSFSITVME